MIPKETVDQIFSAAKIEDVVSDYVTLRRRGANLIGLCPFHTEKTPSFNVNPARNICKCFGCGKGGNPVNFLMEIESCSYREALLLLAKKYHIDVEEKEQTAEQKQRQDDRESMFALNDWANKWFQDQLWNTEEGQTVALAYFHERGLTDATIRRFQLGFSPEKGNPMTKAALASGAAEKYLVNDYDSRLGTGLCGKSSGENGREPRLYDRYHGRVMFPIQTRTGKVVGFAGRIMVKKDNVGKYVNSPESLIYSKTRELYGIAQAKQAICRADRCYLVEGQMDVISMSQAGIENVVSSGGTALTKEHVSLIHGFTNNVTILYDGDAAGIHAALRAIDMFLDQGMNVKVMLFPDGDDPDSFARKHTSEEFVEYVTAHEEDFIRYKARTLIADAGNDLHKRSEAINNIVASISKLSDNILRELYVRECAQLLGVPEASLFKSLNDYRTGGHASGAAPTAAPDAAQSSQVMNQPLTLIDQNYRNLIRALIRYGERPLQFADAAGNVSTFLVGDYMQQYFGMAGIVFTIPQYTLFFDEFNAHKTEPNFSAEQFFKYHPNPYIAGMTTELLMDKYQLSRIYENPDATEEMSQPELLSRVVQLLYEVHYTVVREQLDALTQRMRREGCTLEIMQQQQALIQVRNQLNALLGKQ